ncbi:MAG: Gfo/Idh/MocA family oxidoreductase [Candidatus Latescibacteria bacterium]|nr:Gfo/Idh/MocA family oxidoreductase [Candidatus Latescibacterota bacterium]
MEPIRVGIVGAGGRHVRSHLEMVTACDKTVLTAVSEVVAERLDEVSGEFDVPGYENYRDMLDDAALDIVHVVTRPNDLTPIVLEVLSRDLHVSVEKPPGLNSAETKTMADAEESSKGTAIVSLNRRYEPVVRSVVKLLEDHGPPTSIRGVYHKHMPSLIGQTAHSLVVYDAIHHVDLTRCFGGDVTDVIPLIRRRIEGIESSSHHESLLQFENGATGTFSSLYGVGARVQRMEVHGDGLSVYMDMTGDTPVQAWIEGKAASLPHVDAKNEVEFFAECIEEGTKPLTTLQDAVKTVRLAEAICGPS